MESLRDGNNQIVVHYKLQDYTHTNETQNGFVLETWQYKKKVKLILVLCASSSALPSIIINRKWKKKYPKRMYAQREEKGRKSLHRTLNLVQKSSNLLILFQAFFFISPESSSQFASSISYCGHHTVCRIAHSSSRSIHRSSLATIHRDPRNLNS